MKAGYFIKHLAGTLFLFLILFISAGRTDFWQGWVYSAISIIMFILGYTILRPEPELLAERNKPGEGAKQLDKSILGLSFLFSLAVYIIAGLDSGRFHWSPNFGPGITVAGIILTATGQLLFLIAQKQNKFFSSTVRIQTDRGHTVCDTGLYSVIRTSAEDKILKKDLPGYREYSERIKYRLLRLLW